VPKEGLRIQDVLVRLAILHLIHNKVCLVFIFIFIFIYFVVAFFVHNCCIFCWVFLNDWWLDLDIYKQMKLRYLFFQGVISEIESFLLVGAGEGND
jgi:hypothetical protein